MAAQKGFEALSEVIARQKNMAVDIGNEVDSQNGNVTSLRVSVHVFSGRPDPEWIIHPSNRNFEDILHGVIGHASTPLGAHLGYSGFSIDICKDKVTSLLVRVHVLSGMPDPEWIIHPSNRNFEDILHGVIDHASTSLGAHLGYRGFSIDIFKGGACHRTVDVGNCTRPAFEALLLNTVKVLIPEGSSELLCDSFIDYIRLPIENCPNT